MFLATALLVSALVAQATPPAVPPPAPATTLDQRIDPAKVTTVELPPLPRSVAQPLPSVFRIADRAEEVPLSSDAFAAARQAIDRGLDSLRKAQRPNGAWMERELVQPTDQPRASSAALAVTALGAKAFLQARPDDPAAKRALDFVVAGVRDRGYEGIAETGVGTYVTSAVLSALASAKGDVYVDEIRTAIDWLRVSQWDEGEGLRKDQDWYGGAGYGRGRRPDLSNTQFMLDALHDAGVSADDPTVQKALAFVTRTQNLPATNPSSWAKAGAADGGFVYSGANGGESMASEKAGEGRFGETMPAGQPRSLRSYGSMTYAGFKSMLYAGLTKDDERVKAAYDWIRRHYTFAENPGLGQDGLFYYYHAMARALVAAQQHVIATPQADGGSEDRNWRDDLVAALVKRQREDGSWLNTSSRWEENQPDLVTIYAVLALEEAIKPVMRVE